MSYDTNQTSEGYSGQSSKLDSSAFYIFLILVILTPLAFLPTRYVSIDLVKTIIIVLGTIIPAILYASIAIKEKRLILPPKNLTWTGILISVSLLISALSSIQVSKSLFGQGFELSTASFIIILFLSALVSYTIVRRKNDRAIVLYFGLIISFLILYVFHAIRLIFGQDILSLGILGSMTSTVFQNWYDLSVYAAIVALISLTAIIFLPLSRKVKIAYWVLTVISAFGVFLIDNTKLWIVAALVLLGLTIYTTSLKSRPQGPAFASFFKRLTWIPLIALIISVLFAWKGHVIANPTINSLNARYSALSLPWQMTLDIGSSAIKNYPIFGIGPNHFTQAFLAYKPSAINATDAWGIEFTYGFGLIPTLMIMQGMVGVVLWILFLVFWGIVGSKILKRLPDDATMRFIIISSYVSATLLWLMTIWSLPMHSLLFMAFVLTGIFLGASVSCGLINPITLSPQPGSKSSKVLLTIITILIIVAIVWGAIYVKKTVALSYFG